MTASITRQNHYVPIWYQKRFLPKENQSLFYLDLDPPKFVLADRRIVVGKSLTPRAPKSCFWSEDLMALPGKAGVPCVARNRKGSVAALQGALAFRRRNNYWTHRRIITISG